MVGDTAARWLRRAQRWLIGAAFFGLLANAAAGGPQENAKLDCGVNALYVLLRLEGRCVTLDGLESVLPARHVDGYSMAELSAAARSFGAALEGVRFVSGDKPLSRPAIAFLKDAKGGHFAVLRPTGTTGTMVQVIDPPFAPWIADYDRVFSAKPWTGRILLVQDPWRVRNALPLSAALAGVFLLVICLIPSRTRRMVPSALARMAAFFRPQRRADWQTDH